MRDKIIDGLVKLIEKIDEDIVMIQIRNSSGDSRIWAKLQPLPTDVDWEAEVTLEDGKTYTPEEAWKKIQDASTER